MKGRLRNWSAYYFDFTLFNSVDKKTPFSTPTCSALFCYGTFELFSTRFDSQALSSVNMSSSVHACRYSYSLYARPTLIKLLLRRPSPSFCCFFAPLQHLHFRTVGHCLPFHTRSAHCAHHSLTSNLALLRSFTLSTDLSSSLFCLPTHIFWERVGSYDEHGEN